VNQFTPWLNFFGEACIDASGSFLGILGPLEGCHARSYLGRALEAWELHAAKGGNGTIYAKDARVKG